MYVSVFIVILIWVRDIIVYGVFVLFFFKFWSIIILKYVKFYVINLVLVGCYVNICYIVICVIDVR